MTFSLKQRAEINAINIAKGKGEEAPVTVTIGLIFESVPADPVAAALGCRTQDLDAWFNESGEARFNGIEDITTWGTFEKTHTIKMLDFETDVAKVSKIKIKPVGGKRFYLTTNVQLQDPPEHVIEEIAASLHTDAEVELNHQSTLPLGDEQDGGEGGPDLNLAA